MTGSGEIAVESVFAAFGIDAEYVPQSGPSVNVRVVSKHKDEVVGFDMTRIHTTTRIFELRRYENITPLDGDTLIVNGDSYLIQGEPQILDTDRLVWTLDTRPA